MRKADYTELRCLDMRDLLNPVPQSMYQKDIMFVHSFWFALLAFLCLFNSSYAQLLTLDQQISLLKKSSWTDLNYHLQQKGFEFYNSDDNDGNSLKRISYSYKKENYGTKAMAWLYIDVNGDIPIQSTYQFHDLDHFNSIYNSIRSRGIKEIANDISDDQVTTTYSYQKYYIEVQNHVKEDEGYQSYRSAIYMIIITKKGSVYDDQNGPETLYHPNGNIWMKYTLKDGQMEGPYSLYYEDGSLEMSGSFKGGQKHGEFKEYSELGEISAKYTTVEGQLNGSMITYDPKGSIESRGYYLKDKKHGTFKYYEDNKIVKQHTYVNGMMEGPFFEIETINDSTSLKIDGYLTDGRLNGKASQYLIQTGKANQLQYEYYYQDDLMHGDYRTIKKDTLIIGKMQNGLKHGKHQYYHNFIAYLEHRSTTVEEARALVAEGEFYEGRKHGHWRYYDFGDLLREGDYEHGKRQGTWTFYVGHAIPDGTKNLDKYIGNLLRRTNYNHGVLNGKYEVFIQNFDQTAPCPTDSNLSILDDTCHYRFYEACHNTLFLDQGKLEGPATYKDSFGRITSQGQFSDDQPSGRWTYIDYDQGLFGDTVATSEKGFYKDGERSGKWKTLIGDTLLVGERFYKNGEIGRAHV